MDHGKKDSYELPKAIDFDSLPPPDSENRPIYLNDQFMTGHPKTEIITPLVSQASRPANTVYQQRTSAS